MKELYEDCEKNIGEQISYENLMDWIKRYGLPMEKQQIINAYLAGQNSDSMNDGMGESAEDYFKQEYEHGTN